MTKFYFGKTRENNGKTSGKQSKTIKNIGKYWMTKFYFGKTRENTWKTWENMQKHGKALDDKVLVRENKGKHRENTGKHRENIGKTKENNQ